MAYPSPAAARYVRSLGPESSARSIITNFLNQYGLGELAGWAWATYLLLGGGPDAIQQIQDELPRTPQFKARFPAYDALAKAGHAMSPGDIIALENSYRAALHGAGIPEGFYDAPADFADWMIKNVSPAEIARRAEIAATAVLQDDPQVRRQLQALGVTPGQEIAWTLDPDRALPLIQNTILAAQNAAQGVLTGYGQLTRPQALKLAQAGITPDQARSVFTALGMERDLFAATTEEGQDIGQQEQLNAAFGGSVGAQRRIEERRRQRLGAYAGGAGYNPTSRGVTGLGSTG